MKSDHDAFVACADESADGVFRFFLFGLRFDCADDLDSDVARVVEFSADIGFDLHGFEPVPDIAFVCGNDGCADEPSCGVEQEDVAFFDIAEDEPETFAEDGLTVCCGVCAEILL